MLTLCCIGGSTKTRKAGKDQIGEKGIGFKSVFRVASEVFIASRGYDFKFDKHEKLGMVTPRCAAYPDTRVLDTTQTYLKVEDRPDDDGYLYDAILAQLKVLNRALLLFLRKIKAITITLNIGSTLLTRVLSYSELSIGGSEGCRLSMAPGAQI